MYSVVHEFTALERNGVLSGVAAPSGGARPCLLNLRADGVLIAAARATRFSKKAQARGTRFGWCAFEMRGLDTAFALGDRVELRCGVSEKLLWRARGRVPGARLRQAVRDRYLSVAQIVSLSQAVDSSPTLKEIAVFAQAHLASFGREAFVEATYQTLLGRSVDRDGLVRWADEANLVDELMVACASSTEFKSLVFPVIPGPFSPAFHYSLSPPL